MSDIEIQLESVSFQLHELRETYSQERITGCIKELESIKRKLQQGTLSTCYEDQQHELVDYYETRYNEAKQAIFCLEKELEEIRQKEEDMRNSYSADVLVERANFSNDENHPLNLHGRNSLQKELESFKSMENELAEMEMKIHNKEKENQEYREQIKQLETSNTIYTEQVEHFMKQEEELTHQMEEYEQKISKLTIENKLMINESVGLKEENEFLNSKVSLLEKQEEQAEKDFSILEAKLKALEKENQNLQAHVKELDEENMVLKEEKTNLSLEFKTVYKDLKDQVTHHRTESLKHKTYKPVNHFYMKSEQNLKLENDCEPRKTLETKNTEELNSTPRDLNPLSNENDLHGIENFNSSLSDFGRRSLQELGQNISFHEEKLNPRITVDKSLFVKSQDKKSFEEILEEKSKSGRYDCAANCNMF